jgi:archaeosine synthase
MKGKVRTYLLVNPPYVKDAKKEVDESVEYALKHSDSIVLINTLPHSKSPLFDLWIKGEWNFLGRKEFEDATERWREHPKVEFDVETFKFTPKFPERLEKPLVGVGEEYLTHPYFEVWQDFLSRWYTPPKGKRVLLLLPCAYKKPYRESETHRKIIETLEKTGLRGRIHEVMLSNAGAIPREFEDEYPFNAYDWSEEEETPEVKDRYIQVTSDRIRRYLESHGGCYEKVLCYLKYDSESYKALKKACEELGIDAKNLLTEETYRRIIGEKKPLTKEAALRDLEAGVSDEVR